MWHSGFWSISVHLREFCTEVTDDGDTIRSTGICTFYFNKFNFVLLRYQDVLGYTGRRLIATHGRRLRYIFISSDKCLQFVQILHFFTQRSEGGVCAAFTRNCHSDWVNRIMKGNRIMMMRTPFSFKCLSRIFRWRSCVCVCLCRNVRVDPGVSLV